MKKKSTLNPIDRTRKAKRRYFAAVLTCVLAYAVCTPAFAAGEDPLTAINNLSTFVFSANQSHRRDPAGLGCGADRSELAVP